MTITRSRARAATTFCGAAILAVLGLVESAPGQCETGKLLAPDGSEGDNLGDSVSIDVGVAVGAAHAFDLASCVCRADLDGDGTVAFGDVVPILAAWGNTGGPEDLDDSGAVDFGDVIVVVAAWGPCE